MQVRMGATRTSELRTRLEAVHMSKKVLEAVRLVTAARIRRTAEDAFGSRPFSEKVQEVRKQQESECVKGWGPARPARFSDPRSR